MIKTIQFKLKQFTKKIPRDFSPQGYITIKHVKIKKLFSCKDKNILMYGTFLYLK